MSKKLNDSTIATITSLSDADYLNPVLPSTGEIQKITIADFKIATNGGVKVFAGTIQQGGTSAPTINISINTTGATFTPSRIGVGSYELTCSTTLFGVSKTLCFFNNSTAAPVGASRSDTDTISIQTSADGILTLCSFKIEVYP